MQVLVEFTIEPFVEGNPGAHVRAAVAAAESCGATVDFGPFGSSCRVPVDQVAALTSSVIDAAVRAGATHVSIHVERLDASGAAG